MDIYLNGQFLPHDQGRIGVGDAGLQHAVGLFETMAAYHGRVFRLDRHLDRLLTSSQALGLTRDLDVAGLAQAVQRTIEHNHLDRARLRLTVTAGDVALLGRDDRPTAPIPPTVLITPSEPVQYAPAYFTRGIIVLVGQPLANPFDPLAGHKTLAYWARLRALRQAARAGAGEVVILNVTNHLASGAVSNVFVVKDGQLLTPFARGEEVGGALAAPVLPGITRAAVIELASALDIPVYRRMLSVADLLDADEVFLTNSSWHILPVTQVEKRTIGAAPGLRDAPSATGATDTPDTPGGIGPVTTRLRAALLELIERETGSGAG